MAEERRKGPPDRRRGTRAKPAQPRDEVVDAQDPNDVARFDAEQLDASIREREREDRGEVF